MNFKVSIIVPVYNVEKYLYRCLNSLVNQTLSDIQIIVINDGATDNSQEIINKFVKEYPTKVFSYVKLNGGLGDARNYGLQFVEAEYIGFVDSDDYVEADMYELLYKEMKENNSDLAICDIEYEWENSSRKSKLNGIKKVKNLSPKESLFLSPLFAWNKLYSFKLFKDTNLSYPKLLWYEDIPVTIPVFALVNNFTYIEKVLIHYVQRESSIMSSFDNKKMFDIFEILRITDERLIKLGLSEKYKNEIEFLYIEQLLLYGAFRFYKSKFSNELMLHSLIVMKNKFNDWKSNKYIKELPFHYRLYLYTLNRFTYKIYKLYVRITKR